MAYISPWKSADNLALLIWDDTSGIKELKQTRGFKVGFIVRIKVAGNTGDDLNHRRSNARAEETKNEDYEDDEGRSVDHECNQFPRYWWWRWWSWYWWSWCKIIVINEMLRNFKMLLFLMFMNKVIKTTSRWSGMQRCFLIPCLHPASSPKGQPHHRPSHIQRCPGDCRFTWWRRMYMSAGGGISLPFTAIGAESLSSSGPLHSAAPLTRPAAG